MNLFRLTPALAIFAMAPSATAAQSMERSIERLVESLAMTAERIAARVERNAGRIAAKVERELAHRKYRFDWDDDYDRDWPHDRHRDRDRDRTRESDQPFDIQTARSRIDTTIAFSADGTIDLSNISGDIIVTGWDRREVHIRAYSERGRLEWDLTPSRVTLEVHSARGNGGGRYTGETKYELSVPRGARVIAKSSSGDIVLTGTAGEVEANSTSGDLEITDAAGRIEIGTLSGEIRGRSLKGDVQANSVNGNIELDQVQGEIRMSTTSGDITLLGATSRMVDASTTSGEITYDGTIDANGRYEFHSHSGGIDLMIPATSNARFSIESFSGEMDSDFPVTLQPGDRGGRRPQRFEFNVGNGGARVIAESFSGNIDIRKR